MEENGSHRLHVLRVDIDSCKRAAEIFKDDLVVNQPINAIDANLKDITRLEDALSAQVHKDSGVVTVIVLHCERALPVRKFHTVTVPVRSAGRVRNSLVPPTTNAHTGVEGKRIWDSTHRVPH